MLVNINDTVRVKLTQRGLDILKEQHEELREVAPAFIGEFSPPATDAEGRTSFHLWTLMNTFGPYLQMGTDLPFETTIILGESL